MAIDRRAFLRGSLASGGALIARKGIGRGIVSDGAALAAEAIVTIRDGQLRGFRADGVYNFKCIPYGATTAGGNRFLPPKRLEPWSGVRDATRFGPMPMQNAITDPIYRQLIGGIYPPDPCPMSEDCLSLNVWSPELTTQAKRPVMVWLHPGGLDIGGGSAPWSDGAALAKLRDVVVVSLNHRLGIFGFMYLGHACGPRFAESGNVGLLDIVAALRWIHENISVFGGDFDNVTIFGESGGAMKVSALMAMPAAKGLFHKAIVQSDSSLKAASRDVAIQMTADYLGSIKVTPNDIETLQSMPPETLLKSSKAIKNFFGVFSVTGDALPRDPFFPDAPAVTADVPMLIGTTKNDGTYTALGIDKENLFQLSEQSLSQAVLDGAWDEGVSGELSAHLIQAYRKLYPRSKASDCYFGIVTGTWQDDAIAQAELKAAQRAAPAYMYVFNWESPANGGLFKSSHTYEIPFVFDNLGAASSLFDPHPKPQDYFLAGNMSKAWTAFAHSGNPNHSGLPHWRPYRPDDRATMLFDHSCRLAVDPGADLRRVFAEIREARLAKVTYYKPESN